jgi:hypothetical protein
MKSFKNIFFYATVIGGFSCLIYFIYVLGSKLKTKGTALAITQGKSQWSDFTESLTHNLQHPLAILLAQIIAIILVARLFGWICTKIGQPTVMGEIVAGIVLGPSLFGMYLPEFADFKPGGAYPFYVYHWDGA